MAGIKILIVAFADSIHTAKWISQFEHDEYDIYLFPSMPFKDPHPLLENVTVLQLQSATTKKENLFHTRPALKFYSFFEKIIGTNNARKIIQKFFLLKIQQRALQHAVKTIKPLVVHTMETQHAGYQVSGIRQRLPAFKWIHSTWGIDLHYFQDFPDHQHRLKKLFSQIDLLLAEGARDVKLAHDFGFDKNSIIIPSVGGSMDFDLISSNDLKINPADRKIIILKGYEWSGRLASAALKALRNIKQLLSGFEVVIYSCNPGLLPMIKEIEEKKEFAVRVMAEDGYDEFLKLVSKSRISITNNLSDGVPNTMLEAMALGAFPIQSNTAITEGWIQDGVNGILTDPRDEHNIANAIGRALQDDDLVNAAAVFNRKLVRVKLAPAVIKNQIDALYKNGFAAIKNFE